MAYSKRKYKRTRYKKIKSRKKHNKFKLVRKTRNSKKKNY